MTNRLTRTLAIAVGFVASGALASGCAGPGDDVSTPAADGSRRGELAVYISDDLDGASQKHYFLRDAAGNELPLLFDSEPELAPNTAIKVWGAETGEALHVLSFERVPVAAPTIESALIGATAFTPRTFAFILVDIGNGFSNVRGSNGSSVPVTPDYVLGRMQNDPDSIRNYYLSDSYQTQDTSTKVIGPLTYTVNGCDTSAMARALRPMVDAQGGPFNHYLWYYGSNNSACSWSGLASVGTANSPSKDTWYNASTSCVVLVQEPGHNFGMQHSSSLACTGASFADDPNTCTNSEYGDRFDPMGGGCRHMNAWQKAYQGWFGGCNGVRVTNSGTFNLVPYEPSCNGVQFLQVKAPKARDYMRPAGGGGNATTEHLNFYYLELRTPVDFDGTVGNSSALSARVLVHVADDLHTRTQAGVHPFLLDMTPSTAGSSGFNDAALPVGQSFTDPAGGLTITNMATSNTGATIQITYTAGSGGPTCIDGTAFTPPGPGAESCSTSAPPTGAAGTSGGTAGTTGTGGATGRGGAGGSTGPRGGAGGSIGPVTGGTTGTGGTGTPGSGGTTGQGGTTPSSVGQAGSTGAGGTTGQSPNDRGVSGGCACDATASGPASLAATLLAFAGIALTIAARRRVAVRSRRAR